jgi:hypothetical protein
LQPRQPNSAIHLIGGEVRRFEVGGIRPAVLWKTTPSGGLYSQAGRLPKVRTKRDASTSGARWCRDREARASGRLHKVETKRDASTSGDYAEPGIHASETLAQGQDEARRFDQWSINLVARRSGDRLPLGRSQRHRPSCFCFWKTTLS